MNETIARKLEGRVRAADAPPRTQEAGSSPPILQTGWRRKAGPGSTLSSTLMLHPGRLPLAAPRPLRVPRQPLGRHSGPSLGTSGLAAGSRSAPFPVLSKFPARGAPCGDFRFRSALVLGLETLQWLLQRLYSLSLV